MDPLDELRLKLERSGYSGAMAELDGMCQTLWRVVDEQMEGEIAHFHDLAGRFPSSGGHDYGALMLERTAELAAPSRREFLLRHALYRATWAADCFEFGTRQSDDYQRIASKL